MNDTYCNCGTIPEASADIGVIGVADIGVIGLPIIGVTGATEGFDG